MTSTPQPPKLPWLKAIGKIPLIISLIIIVLLATVGPLFASNKEIALDIAFLELLHKIIPPFIGQILTVIYKITGVHVTLFFVLGSLSFLIWKRYWEEAKYLAVATLGILLLVDQILKPLFNRIRPGSFDNNLASLVEVDGKSFPSGHAAGSVVFYFYMAFVLAAHFPERRKLIYLIAFIWVGLVGLSSTYCRVHWGSDIIAGYGVGFVWLTFSLALLKRAEPKFVRSSFNSKIDSHPSSE
ncbi:MAG: phosphatase PAP2 family protein [Microcystaceae cyanobacterium]